MTIELDKYFNSIYNPDEPGAAILILKNDTIIYDKGFGISDLETKAKIDGNTFFNIASISKQFTAVAIMKLAEEGKISLDDNVKKYFPSFKADFFNKITIRHLLSHSSGIMDQRPRDNRDFVLYCTDIESIKYMEEITELRFEPGSNYEYVNPTFQLLYVIIEQASGMSFEDYMKKFIFTPSNMNSTIYFSPEKNIPNMAHGYILSEDNLSNKGTESERSPEAEAAANEIKKGAKSFGKFKECDYGEETFFATKADGGIYTSTHQFVNWFNSISNNKVISPKSILEAQTPKTVVSNSPFSSYQNRPNTWYGYGWFIEKENDEIFKIYHTGGNGGFQTYEATYPDQNVSIILFGNRDDISLWTNVLSIESILKNNNIL